MKKSKVLALCMVIVLIVSLSLSLTACDVFDSSSSLSAYEIAVKNGFTGTEEEWLESLKGDTIYENSAYDVAVKNGFEGTEAEWLASLKGETGDKGETSISDAVNKAVLSVVSINAYFTKTSTQFGWGGKPSQQSSEYGSAGSGVIFKADKENGIAYIVTNYHVIYDVDADVNISENIYIYLYGMELSKYQISAEYIGGSMSYDIAVLKIQSDIFKNSNAVAANIGSSGDMSIGDTVIAIGNPEAEGIAVTQGILSLESEYITMTAADNTTNMTIRVMRIDAAVNGGNSGGGLFNDSGELVGIVNAKVVDEDIEGMAYAIPIDLAYAAVTNIMNNCDGSSNTSIQRCLLGITVQSTDSWTVVDETTGKVTIKNNVSVVEVESGAVAENILQSGDIITAIRYKTVLYTVNREYDITNLSLLFMKGDTIEVQFTRNGISNTKTITLGNATTVK